MPSRKFNNGDKAMGKWPGSSLYFEIRIVSFDSSKQLYSVVFKDGTDMELKESDIRSLNIFRSKKGSTSPSRRSRSRSRTRSRSPARSPGRTPKSAKKSSPAVRDSRKGEYLKVQLTPLKLEDFNVVTRNGDNINARNVELDEKPAADRAEEEVEIEEMQVKNEKVLHYVRRKQYFADYERKAIHQEFISKPAVAEKIVPVEKPMIEFGGAVGAGLLTLSMPPLLYYLVYMSGQKDAALSNFYPSWTFSDLWDSTVFGYYALWILLLALLYLFPIGTISHGVLLANGKRLSYRSNGLFSLFLIGLLVAELIYQRISLLYVYDHLRQFVSSATVLSVILSVFVFVRSRRATQEELSVAGKSGNFIYAFFMGRELNPHIGKFDLKYFTAVHAALIGWVFINFILLLAEMKTQELESPSPSMILVNSFQLLYVLHALWNQDGMLTSLDIAHDGFGFMLAFGNLVWVPFAYTLQAAYLVRHPVEISRIVLGAIVAMNTLGYVIFRNANKQKNAYRKNPQDPRLSLVLIEYSLSTDLKSIPTSCGSKLLVSGWWGFVRHPNYVGDIIMAWAWCLPCGFNHVLPYFYGFFLTGLLLHRHSLNYKYCNCQEFDTNI
ncbi:unnamed protein product [Ranitomeya imitator]|uniref:Lamin-B receptor of TUDOR domain-containing protein n=1 Tax=Ranitomeya imitator TaxID=111125 RepID=A0ABN9ML11_9NEOB|nr:unnamed protein product [Ranitomeya imitator]